MRPRVQVTLVQLLKDLKTGTMDKKKRVRRVSTEAKKKRLVPITILPDLKPDTPYYYVNYAAVSHSPYDFSMTVLRIPAELSPEQKELAKVGKPVPIEPLLQLILPPRLIGGLIRAFTDQQQKYEKSFGQIRKDDKKSNGKSN